MYVSYAGQIMFFFYSISLLQFLYDFDFYFTSKEKQVLNIWSLPHVWESYFEAVILSNEFITSGIHVNKK